MAYCVGGQVLEKVNCSGMGQSKKERERGGEHDARRNKFWWLIKKKEDEDVWLRNRERARLKRGSWAEGFWAQGFH
jgi:hypothetical protein